MCRTLHHGQRIYWLCGNPGDHAQCRRRLVEAKGMQSGAAGQFGDSGLGQSIPMTFNCKADDQGIINTFTEHHGGPWTHKDMQHTMMVCLLSLFFSLDM